MLSEHAPSRLSTWTGGVVLVMVLYVLSSGPLLATAFWLREQTHRDEFYAIMFLYYPLIALGHNTPFTAYIEWWVRLFGTVGPG